MNERTMGFCGFIILSVRLLNSFQLSFFGQSRLRVGGHKAEFACLCSYFTAEKLFPHSSVHFAVHSVVYGTVLKHARDGSFTYQYFERDPLKFLISFCELIDRIRNPQPKCNDKSGELSSPGKFLKADAQPLHADRTREMGFFSALDFFVI